MFFTIKLRTYAKLNFLKQNYFHKMDLALNKLQRLICHKTQPTNQPTNCISIFKTFYKISTNLLATVFLCFFLRQNEVILLLKMFMRTEKNKKTKLSQNQVTDITQRKLRCPG